MQVKWIKSPGNLLTFSIYFYSCTRRFDRTWKHESWPFNFKFEASAKSVTVKHVNHQIDKPNENISSWWLFMDRLCWCPSKVQLFHGTNKLNAKRIEVWPRRWTSPLHHRNVCPYKNPRWSRWFRSGSMDIFSGLQLCRLSNLKCLSQPNRWLVPRYRSLCVFGWPSYWVRFLSEQSPVSS